MHRTLAISLTQKCNAKCEMLYNSLKYKGGRSEEIF